MFSCDTYNNCYLMNSTRSVMPNLKSTVYCTGIAEGSSGDWEFAWQAAQATNLASERDLLLTALGCSKNETILYKWGEYIFYCFSRNSI